MAKKQRKDKRWISWIIMIVLFVIATIVVYLVWDSYFRDKSDGLDGDRMDSPVEVANNDKKEVNTDVTSEHGSMSDKDTKDGKNESDSNNDGDDPNTYGDLTGVVTYADAVDNQLMIRVNIDQFLADGVCQLELMKGSDIVYNDTATIVNSAATATCKGFNVPISEMMNGHLKIHITLNSDGRSGLISGEVDV